MNDTNKDDTDRPRPAGQLKRFENKAQLLRHISQTERVDIDELWRQYDEQIDADAEQSQEAVRDE